MFSSSSLADVASDHLHQYAVDIPVLREPYTYPASHQALQGFETFQGDQILYHFLL